MTHTRTRGGFTLVELLVVILLIVILAALSAGAFFRVQSAQRNQATESTIRKLQIGLDARWKEVLYDARKTVPDPIVTLAGGDKDRAISIWSYAKLKNEFPENFVEATTPITFVVPPTMQTVTLQPREVFRNIAAKTYSPTPTLDEQASALFYAALTQTGTGGAAFDLEGVNQHVGTTPSGLTVFTDTWGTPLTFRRWANPPEVQQEPYIRPNTIRSRSGTSLSFNPLDPSGKLLGTYANSALNRLDNPWGTDMSGQNFQQRTAALNALFPGQNLTMFPNENFVPTLVSAGPDKVFGGDIYGATDDAGKDNIVGYRLRREGNKGD